MKSKIPRRLLIVSVFVVFCPIVVLEGISIYSYLQFVLKPSATAQFLDFVEVPQNTELPRINVQATDYAYRTNAYHTDYQPVEIILTQRFPIGTPKQEIEQFTAKQSCKVGNEELLCLFKSTWYPSFSPVLISPIGFIAACSDYVYLTFSFDTFNKLKGIKVIGSTICV